MIVVSFPRLCFVFHSSFDISRIVHHGVEHCVVMTWIMMKKQKPADFRVERERNGAGNRTVPPSDVTFVLCIGVLRVENQNIAAVKKVDQTDSLLFSSLFRLVWTHITGPR